MSHGLRVMLFHGGADVEQITAAYELVSTRLAAVPGLLGNELLQSERTATEFVVVSRWRDRAAFDAWEQGAAHQDDTAPLRPFRQAGPSIAFGIYRVLAEH